MQRLSNDPDLKDDRQIEWCFCGNNTPTGKKVLDIGCNMSILSTYALNRNNTVTGIDIEQGQKIDHKNFTFIQTDFLKYKTKEKFDFIYACSTVEHIGLSGRYSNEEDEDGDLKAMKKIRSLLAPFGRVALTIPVGTDKIVKPVHRIYGNKRIEALLEDFRVDKSEAWHKMDGYHWQRVGGEYTSEIEGSEKYYCLGLFLLEGK